MERSVSLQQIGRLGFCKQTAPWSEANLGAGNFAQIYSSGRTTRGNPEAIRMAYFPAHVLDVAAECRDRVQGDARVVAAFVLAVYVGRLHAGNFARKARCAGSSPRSSVHRRNEHHGVERKRGQLVLSACSKTILIDEKGCKKGARTCLFAPLLVSRELD